MNTVTSPRLSPGQNVRIAVGTASTAYRQNLMYHPDAFTFVTADLPLMDDAHKCSRMTQDGLSLRANRAAFEVHTLRQELDSIDNQLALREDDLVDRDLADDARRRLRAEIRALDRDRARLLADLHAAQRHLDRLLDETGSRP